MRPRSSGRSTTSSASASACRCCATWKPSGRYVATDLHRAGGVPQVMKLLLDAGLLHGDCMTITGRTLAEELADVPAVPDAGQDVIHAIDDALYAQGHLAILRGNLAVDGCVAKITGLKNPVMTGPARVFDSEDDAMAAIMARAIRPGDVVVIRYEGPRGGPGMREMLAPTSALVGQGTRRIGRADHRWPLLRRHVGMVVGTSRPRHSSAARSR